MMKWINYFYTRDILVGEGVKLFYLLAHAAKVFNQNEILFLSTFLQAVARSVMKIINVYLYLFSSRNKIYSDAFVFVPNFKRKTITF